LLGDIRLSNIVEIDCGLYVAVVSYGKSIESVNEPLASLFGQAIGISGHAALVEHFFLKGFWRSTLAEPIEACRLLSA
jgi:predicted Zn-dependent protease